MPVNKLNVTLTPPQEAAIQAAIDALKLNVPFRLNLTVDEKTEFPNLQDKRYSFTSKVIENHAPANPNLVSGFAGTLLEAQTDFICYKQLREFILQLKSVLESYLDTQQVAGAEAYVFARAFYNTAQDAAKNNVPGADAIVNDLKPLFEEQGPPPGP